MCVGYIVPVCRKSTQRPDVAEQRIENTTLCGAEKLYAISVGEQNRPFAKYIYNRSEEILTWVPLPLCLK